MFQSFKMKKYLKVVKKAIDDTMPIFREMFSNEYEVIMGKDALNIHIASSAIIKKWHEILMNKVAEFTEEKNHEEAELFRQIIEKPENYGMEKYNGVIEELGYTPLIILTFLYFSGEKEHLDVDLAGQADMYGQKAMNKIMVQVDKEKKAEKNQNN